MDSGHLNVRKIKNVDLTLIQEWLNKKHIRKWFGEPSVNGEDIDTVNCSKVWSE